MIFMLVPAQGSQRRVHSAVLTAQCSQRRVHRPIVNIDIHCCIGPVHVQPSIQSGFMDNLPSTQDRVLHVGLEQGPTIHAPSIVGHQSWSPCITFIQSPELVSLHHSVPHTARQGAINTKGHNVSPLK